MARNVPDLRAKNVLVVGLGRNQGGAGVARWSAEQGATVRVTDLGDPDSLQASVRALSGLPIDFVLGRHDEADVEWADIVIRNPAVPAQAPMLAHARALGRPVLMEMAIFLARSAATVIGITGSKGKTTTSYACHHLVAPSVKTCVLVGNMGISALEHDGLDAGAVAVAELSSFQLEGTDEVGVSPPVAVLTSLFEDHLDRYAGFEEYARAKLAIFDHQSPSDWAIVPATAPGAVAPHIRARVARFASAPGAVAGIGEFGAWLHGGMIRCRWGGEEVDLLPRSELPLPGEHGVANACAAVCAALAVGVAPSDIAARLATVPTARHRLEHVATVGGVDYVNDTTATTPTSAAASLQAFAGRDVVLIMGGSEKRLDPGPLAAVLAGAVRAAVLFDDSASPGLAAAARAHGFSAIHGPVSSMAEAVAEASRIARPGTVVLLAPGAASFGLFTNEFDRGLQFCDCVLRLHDPPRYA